MDNLTEEKYWDEYWSGIKLPVLVDTKIQWQLSLAKKFLSIIPQNSSLQLFEVGCAPGRWLVWFSKETGCKVSGCDTSPGGVRLTLENLRLNDVEATVYRKDLFSDDLPKHIFDIVISLGVIEHFNNPEKVVSCHLELLKPGGKLIIEVPNMAGQVNYRLLKMAKMDDLLSRHNLSIMNKDFFYLMAKRFNLKIEFLDYIGGFDPMMITKNSPYKKLWGRPFVLNVLKFAEELFGLAPGFFLRFNSPFCSNMLFAVFAKSNE